MGRGAMGRGGKQIGSRGCCSSPQRVHSLYVPEAMLEPLELGDDSGASVLLQLDPVVKEKAQLIVESAKSAPQEAVEAAESPPTSRGGGRRRREVARLPEPGALSSPERRRRREMARLPEPNALAIAKPRTTASSGVRSPALTIVRENGSDEWRTDDSESN
eukprot:SAG31_NODE_2256_length_6072_cov_9.043529_6_plen_161_part_00